MDPFTKKENIYIFLTALFSLLVVLANLTTAKWILVPFVPQGLPAGLLLYPFTFLINDLVIEMYGKTLAKRMVYTGFILSLVAWVTLCFIQIYPPARPSDLSLNHLFFGATVLSSITAYLFGQLTDISTYHWIGTKTEALWLRSLGSTLISQLLDTLIVNGLLFFVFAGEPLSEVLPLVIASYLYKAIIATLMVPLFYRMVYVLRPA